MTSTEKRTTLTPAYAAQSPTTPLAPFNIQRRDVRPNDVQLEIVYCGVCHSDLHMARNEWGQTIYPVVPGHEIVGRVTAVGNKVTKFRTGDLAGVGVMVDSCRECPNCVKGLEQYCTKGMVLTYSSRDPRTGELTQGGYSKRIVTHQDFVFRISDKLPLAGVAPLLLEVMGEPPIGQVGDVVELGTLALCREAGDGLPHLRQRHLRHGRLPCATVRRGLLWQERLKVPFDNPATGAASLDFREVNAMLARQRSNAR